MSTVCGNGRCGGQMVKQQYGHNAGELECRTCGWTKPERGRRDKARDNPDQSTHDGQCMHEYGGVRCPMPGNMSAGSVKEWHCRYHHRGGNLAPGPGNDAFYAYVSDADNRKKLFAKWYPNTVNSICNEVARRAALPENQRQEGEGRSEYIARMIASAKSLQAKFEDAAIAKQEGAT